MQKLSFEELPQAVSLINDRLANIERLLSEKNNESNSLVDELLTIEQASVILNLSVPTSYGHVHDREIPFSKKRKRLYFSKTELIEWIKTGRKKTKTEINASAGESITIRKKKRKTHWRFPLMGGGVSIH